MKMNHKMNILKRILYIFLAFVMFVSQPLSTMQSIALAAEDISIESEVQQTEEELAVVEDEDESAGEKEESEEPEENETVEETEDAETSEEIEETEVVDETVETEENGEIENIEESETVEEGSTDELGGAEGVTEEEADVPEGTETEGAEDETKEMIVSKTETVRAKTYNTTINEVSEDEVIVNNGSRLIAEKEGYEGNDYQWQRANEADGEWEDIEGANGKFYDLTTEDSQKFVRVVIDNVAYAQTEKLGDVIIFDLAKQTVKIGPTIQGTDTDGKSIENKKHMAGNIYIIKQKNSDKEFTSNSIIFEGNYDNVPFDVTLDRVNILNELTNARKEVYPNSGDNDKRGSWSDAMISVVATDDAEKDVILRLKDDNSVRFIYYTTGSKSSGKVGKKSSLKITNINGDEETEGGSLYMPKRFESANLENDYIKSKNAYNHWNAGIGGIDSQENVSGLELAGGTIRVVTSYGDNCTAIGGGGNGYCQMKISGGDITAISNGTGAAIGGGIGWSDTGGESNILITGGSVYAHNHGLIYLKDNKLVNKENPQSEEYDQLLGGVAIGSGSSFKNPGSTGGVTIEGGTVTAIGTFGNGIGGGNSSQNTAGFADVEITGSDTIVTANAIGGGSSFTNTGGGATVTITDATVTATATEGNAIGGGNSKAGTGGSATVNIYGDAEVTLKASIGGGDSDNGDGGAATIYVYGGTLKCEGNIGGGNGAKGDKNTALGGDATVNVYGGVLECSGTIGGGTGGENGNGGNAIINVTKHEDYPNAEGTLSAKSIGGGTGGKNANGGTAAIVIERGTVRSGSIGGGNAGEGGKIGYATANISGGDIQGQFLMAGGGTSNCYFRMTGGTLHGVDTADSSVYTYAQENGAAVYMDDPNGEVTITGGTIENCSAVNGGAIYMTAGTFTISGDAKIKDCTATGEGGAVYLGGGNVFVKGGSLTSNEATGNGGAIAIYNGNYKMTGGNVDDNASLSGAGGAIYVSANNTNVDVDVLSGSVSHNQSQGNGGALAVVGKADGTENINVTIGINEVHPCDHNEDGTADSACPVMNNNSAQGSGGAVYVTGNDNAKLNIYCLQESGSSAALDNGQGDFMKMEGGQVVISASKMQDGMTDENQVFNHGNVKIVKNIYVVGGKMNIWGKMSNPSINGIITVDIKKLGDEFKDHRFNDGFYKLIYFENFTDPITNIKTGQYKEKAIPFNGTEIIEKNIYSHPGYQILGWNTHPEQEHNYEPGTDTEYPKHGWYEVSNSYTFDGNPLGDLEIHAIWNRNAYTIHYDPNVPVGTQITGRELMGDEVLNYDVPHNLKKNQFGYPGYIFVKWNTEADGSGTDYADEQLIQNLAQLNGDLLNLYAQWEECDHIPTEGKCGFEFFIIDEGELKQTIVKECTCKGYRETYTLSAENTEYNMLAHPAELEIAPESVTSIPTITYKKIVDDNEILLDAGNEPINAGTYKAGIAMSAVNIDGEKITGSVEVTYLIDKAKQPAPERPIDHVLTEDAEHKSILKVTEFADSPLKQKDPTGYTCIKEYKIGYYDSENNLHETDWQTSNEFHLTVALTNYLIYVRYGECENYYASSEVLAEENCFYPGNVKVRIIPGIGVDFEDVYAVGSDNENNGITLKIWELDGFYFPDDYSIKFTATINDSDQIISSITLTKQESITEDGVYKLPYVLENIPNDCSITITLGDAIKAPTIEAKVEEKQIFESVSKTEATISRDSAYTAYFKVQNMNYDYDSNWNLKFSRNIPVGTTIIMLDKTNHAYYWHEVTENSVNSLAMEEFVRMGSETGTDKYTLPTVTDSEGTAVYEDEIELQFIVDFSEVSKKNYVDLSSEDTLITYLLINKSKETGVNERTLEIISDKSIDDLDKKAVTELKTEDDFKIEYTYAVSLDQRLKLIYDESDGVASIWDDRQAALVLVPVTTDIPADSYIEYFDGTYTSTVYKNSEGQFIIPLSDLSDEELQITLASNLFPDEETNYEMNAKWMVADSISELTPYLGDVVAQKGIEFHSFGIYVPAIKIETDARLYEKTGTVHVNVKWNNLERHELTVTLKEKNASGEFVDVGLREKIDTKDSSQKEYQYEIKLEGLGAGSYCLESEVMYDVLLVKDAITKYYFIVE